MTVVCPQHLQRSNAIPDHHLTPPRLTGPLPPHPSLSQLTRPHPSPSHPLDRLTRPLTPHTLSAHQTSPLPLTRPHPSPSPSRLTRPHPSPSHPTSHPSHPLGSPDVCAVICCPSVKSVMLPSSCSHSCTRRVRVRLVASTLGWTELNSDRKFTYARRRGLAEGRRGEGWGGWTTFLTILRHSAAITRFESRLNDDVMP